MFAIATPLKLSSATIPVHALLGPELLSTDIVTKDGTKLSRFALRVLCLYQLFVYT
jgi:hypothetical protein